MVTSATPAHARHRVAELRNNRPPKSSNEVYLTGIVDAASAPALDDEFNRLAARLVCCRGAWGGLSVDGRFRRIGPQELCHAATPGVPSRGCTHRRRVVSAAIRAGWHGRLASPFSF